MKQLPKIFFTLLFLMLAAGCSRHNSESTPTREDTLRTEKVQVLRKEDDIKGIIRELKEYFATNDKQMQAEFRFMNGRYLAVDKVALGRQYMQDGIDKLKECMKEASTLDDKKWCARKILSGYANLISYMYDLSTEERWAKIQEYEDILKQSNDENLLSAQDLDQKYFYLYIFKLQCYMENDDQAKAEEMYQLCQQCLYAKTKQGQAYLDDQLINLGRYQEAIINLERQREEFLNSGDTLDLNENYSSLIQSMATCYEKLGNKQKALEFKSEAQRLWSTIALHHVNQNLEQLGTQYEVQQRQFQLDEERLRFRFSLAFIVVLMLFLALALTGYFYYRHVSRILNEKNKILTENLLRHLEESKAEQQKLDEENEDKEGNDENGSETSLEEADKADDAENAKSVQRFIHELTSRKLFCDINFDRDTLLDGLSISRRTFPHQFETCIGTSVAQYILKLRLEYAADMIRSKPNYTIDSIAQDSGFSSRSTFYRNFSRQFGITPIEYKNQIMQMN